MSDERQQRTVAEYTPTTNTKRISKRGKIYAKTEGHCAYCGVPLEPFGIWHLEHMKPKKDGGGNTIKNLVAACPSCNRLKGQRDVKGFRARLTIDYAAQIISMAEALEDFAAVSPSVNNVIVSLSKAAKDLRSMPLKFYMDEGGV